MLYKTSRNLRSFAASFIVKVNGTFNSLENYAFLKLYLPFCKFIHFLIASTSARKRKSVYGYEWASLTTRQNASQKWFSIYILSLNYSRTAWFTSKYKENKHLSKFLSTSTHGVGIKVYHRRPLGTQQWNVPMKIPEPPSLIYIFFHAYRGKVHYSPWEEFSK